MKHSTNDVDARIKTFLDRKVHQYPDLEQKPVRKIYVRQRGRFLDDLGMLFAVNPTAAKLH